jgi:hypothetical protein
MVNTTSLRRLFVARFPETENGENASKAGKVHAFASLWRLFLLTPVIHYKEAEHETKKA